MIAEFPDDVGSRAVKCLEAAWTKLRRVEPDIPKAVIVLLYAKERYRAANFAPSSWRYAQDKAKHEVGISPRLFSRPRKVLASMLHEAAHGILYEKDGDLNAGCSASNGSYYHNERFRDECLRLGLSCEKLNPRYGFSLTDWPGNRAFPPRYEPILRCLEGELQQLL